MKKRAFVFFLASMAVPFLFASEPRLITEEDFLCHGQEGRSIEYKGKTYLDCAGGHGPQGGVSTEILGLLNRFQARLGRPIAVTSGYRCEEHNRYSWAFVASREGREEGVSLESLHRAGAAADFIVVGVKSLPDYRSFERELRKLAAEGGGGMLPVGVWAHVYAPGVARDPDNQHDSPYVHIHLLGVVRRALPHD